VEKYRWWLEPYAAFTLLRDRYQTARFSDWKEDSEYKEKKIHQLCSQSIDIQRVYYVQFNLWKQLCEAAEYARSKQVILKGDMAIGMYRDSVETWTHPGIFHMDSQMGTPPDNQQPLGQNWGFPTYNWEQNDGIHEKAENIYDWIKKRLQWMEQFFDAIRMDHIVGYFRTWEIPSHCLFSTMGHYAPSLPLTPDEIGQFGLQFRKELMTRPFISDRIIEKVFGIHAPYVREHFLSKKAYGLYDILPQFDTQVKVRDFFAGKDDENSLWIRDGLYRILQNVLFVEDVREPQMYHPRFAVFNEPVYEVLDAEEKDAFMRIYNNYYFERHNSFWQGKASQRLSQMLEDTHMLVCAEDLGLLPACVEPVLDNLRILTLEVQDLPKQYGIEFAHIDSYPFRSVATFATHDMSPMRLWWEESAGRTQRYFTTMLQKQGRAPEKLTTVLAEEIIGRHLYGPSMLCVLLLQDWLSMDGMLRRKNVREERINIPNDSYNHWCYRMHVTIEQLIASTTFNRKLKTMLERSKRYK
jgi:4-alpha-glucanotransferase